MDLKEIINRLSVFFVPGAFIIVTVLALSFVIIKLRKKKSEGKSSGEKKKAFIGSLIVGYFFVVLGITNLSRGEAYSGSINLNLFSGYIDAWNSFSVIAFQLIVFNILMFVPLGVLLPLFSSKFKKFHWTLVASFCATSLIEIFQFGTGRGIFELDDIFHNTLGGVLGYQLYMFIHTIILNKGITFKKLSKYLAIPMLLLIAYVGMLSFYHSKEFGNMSINPTYGTDMSNVELSTTIQLNSKSAHAPVYKNKYSNDKERGRRLAELLQKKLSLPELTDEGRDGENRQFVFREESGTRYYMTYFLRDGTWSLTDDYYSQEEFDNIKEMEAYAKETLAKIDMLPKQAELSITDTGTFRWSIQHSIYPNKDIENGLIMLDLKKDGRVGLLFYDRTENTFVREVELLSTKEAFGKIKDGEFDEFIPFQKGDRLVVTDCEIDYMYDSKGYFQPVYRFSGTLNGEEWSQRVTAIR
jgi:glycopeptide antibiotics resistance protein